MTTETDLDEIIAAATRRLRHARGCSDPTPHFTRGRLGDDMVRCRDCARFVTLHEVPLRAPQGHAHAQPAPVPDKATVTTWRCRDHDAPVTWKGRGCQRCDDARRRPKSEPDE